MSLPENAAKKEKTHLKIAPMTHECVQKYNNALVSLSQAIYIL